MCNDYRLEVDALTIAEDFEDLKIKIRFSEGIPNIQARTDIRITDTAPIVRESERGSGELVQRRWSWPGPTRKPVYNFRSEGREFTSGLLPRPCRWILWIHGAGRPEEEAQGQMAFHEKRRALVLHRWNLAGQRGSW